MLKQIIMNLISIGLLTFFINTPVVAASPIHQKGSFSSSQILAHVGACKIHPEHCGFPPL